MSHGSVDHVIHENVELLQGLLAKQGRIVLLEKQVYSRLEAELESATKAADDAASGKSKLRDVEPAPTKGRRKHRAPHLAEARSECKPTAPAEAQKPKPPAPDEDMTDTFSSSPARLKKKQNKVLSMVRY